MSVKWDLDQTYTPTLRDHAEHGRWKKIGACLYCPCGERLYQGRQPKSIKEQIEISEALGALKEAVGAYFKARVEHDRA
jgi:hypothetical protein